MSGLGKPLPKSITVKWMKQKEDVEFDMDNDLVGEVANKVARTHFKFHGNYSFISPTSGEVLPTRITMQKTPIDYGDTVLLVAVKADE